MTTLACDPECPEGMIVIHYGPPEPQFFPPETWPPLRIPFHYVLFSEAAQLGEICQSLSGAGILCDIHYGVLRIVSVQTPVSFGLPVKRLSIHLQGGRPNVAFPWLFEVGHLRGPGAQAGTFDLAITTRREPRPWVRPRDIAAVERRTWRGEPRTLHPAQMERYRDSALRGHITPQELNAPEIPTTLDRSDIPAGGASTVERGSERAPGADLQDV